MSISEWTWRLGDASYNFRVQPIFTEPKVAPGIYMFGKWVRNRLVILYVGETHNFRTTCYVDLRAHEAYACLRACEVSHIATMYVANGRQALREAFVGAIKPPCNLKIEFGRCPQKPL